MGGSRLARGVDSPFFVPVTKRGKETRMSLLLESSKSAFKQQLELVDFPGINQLGSALPSTGDFFFDRDRRMTRRDGPANKTGGMDGVGGEAVGTNQGLVAVLLAVAFAVRGGAGVGSGFGAGARRTKDLEGKQGWADGADERKEADVGWEKKHHPP